MNNDINILICDEFSEHVKRLFFDDEDVFYFQTVFTMPQLLKSLKLVKSESMLKNSKWDIDIPEGFSEHIFGKSRIKLTILKLASY